MERETDIRELIRRIYGAARELGLCPLFTGEERTLDELMALYTHPQGIEFCMAHRFPGAEVMRELKAMGVERYGVYVDAGDISLTDPGRCFLVGDTRAHVACTRGAHAVYLLQGAEAEVGAYGWAVVTTLAEEGCGLVRRKAGHGVII